MYSEENERLAEQSYSRFRENHDPSLPTWEAFFPKHIWRDLVQTFQANPRSHIAVANAMEQCVSDALLVPYESVQISEENTIVNISLDIQPPTRAIPAPVEEPVKPKPTKTKK